MADVNRGNRPLSPHLQVYRLPPMIAGVSIVHRITGVGLGLTAILVVWWLVAAATGPEYFRFVDAIMTSWFGDLVLAVSLWAFWFHFLNGIRHLVWDMGRGLDKDLARKTGMGIVAGSIILTLVVILVV